MFYIRFFVCYEHFYVFYMRLGLFYMRVSVLYIRVFVFLDIQAFFRLNVIPLLLFGIVQYNFRGGVSGPQSMSLSSLTATRFMDRDVAFWIQDPGSRILDPGSRIQNPGSWIQDPGSWIQKATSWSMNRVAVRDDRLILWGLETPPLKLYRTIQKRSKGITFRQKKAWISKNTKTHI